MNISLFSGSANPRLAGAVACCLGLPLSGCHIEQFPDGEQHIEVLDSVRGHDVYIVQPTSPPADRHLLELLFLADACRRAGAGRLTGVIPYFGYARQDRRARGREPVAARLVADLIETAGLDRVVAVDLHTSAIEGFFRIPLEHLTAVPVLAEAIRPWRRPHNVVVAPDLGASKLAERYAALLDLPMAIVRKTRVSGEEVTATGVTGDVRGCAPLIVDDMISTGGTIAAAVEVLVQAGAVPDVAVAVTHALLAGSAIERLRALPVRQIVFSDTVALPADLPLPMQTASVAPLIADAIGHLHRDESLSELVSHG